MGGGDKHLLSIQRFCTAIITVSPIQRGLILKHITRRQCVYLKEVSLNILINHSISNSLSDSERKYLRAKILDVKKLASHSVCFGEKKKIIEEQQLLIKKLCLIIVNHFEKLQ